jgi:UDP-N-acetylglucosamine acyltransferase
MSIHNTAVISKKARIDESVTVGPYCVIQDGVNIGSGSKIGNHVVIEGNTTIGKNCQIFTGAVVGSKPQDLKYKGEKVFLEIGDNNIIREYCTLNPGTEDGGKTEVGNGNLFMAYSHIAHDCRVGNNCVFANNATLAGHVTVEDMVVIGGLVAVHQFVRIGNLSIIGGCSKVVQDIPPYSTCDGHPAVVYGLNLIGLRRHKVSREVIKELDSSYKVLFNSGFTLKHAIEELEKNKINSLEVNYLIDFARGSKRGISKSCRLEK